MLVVLAVAEKPSIAKAVADALAPGGRYSTRRSQQDVHEWEAPWQGQQARHRLFPGATVTRHRPS